MPSRTTSGQATVSKWMYSQTRRSQPNVPLITALGAVWTAQNPTHSLLDCSPRQHSSQNNGTNLEKLHGATKINTNNSKHEPISVTGTVLCLQLRDRQHKYLVLDSRPKQTRKNPTELEKSAGQPRNIKQDANHKEP